MISRGDFIFTIGYEGNRPVVDGAMKKRYGALSAEQLAEKGLYKQALCAVLYDQGDASVLERIVEIYNRNAEHKLASGEDLKRVFGAFGVPPGIAKALVV